MGERIPIEAQSPVVAAKRAGLHYVNAELPGIRRERKKGKFRYLDAKGKVIREHETLLRIKSLVIPPAWKDVWICSDEHGHLQATGRDARGRKQHRYHVQWREVRDRNKYDRMIAFAKVLPDIRRRVSKDIVLPGLQRNKVLATVVKLLESSLIRVGNEEYARNNKSYGLTTMRDRHVDVRGSRLRFHFSGKSGKEHDVDVEDRRLAKIVRNCQEIPGQDLFQYYDERGKRRDVESGDINDYLREITGQDFTAKDFRTWAGTVLAAKTLKEIGEFSSKTEARRNIVKATEIVAKRLGNTPAICKKCYIHPAIMESYLEETMKVAVQRAAERRSGGRLRAEETEVINLLRQDLKLNPKATAVQSRRNGDARL